MNEKKVKEHLDKTAKEQGCFIVHRSGPDVNGQFLIFSQEWLDQLIDDIKNIPGGVYTVRLDQMHRISMDKVLGPDPEDIVH